MAVDGVRRVVPFGPESRGAFAALHSDANDAGWCQCVAWWVPDWASFGSRSASENAALRDRLCDGGWYDGYLLLDGDDPVAWCQVGPRDRLSKLTAQYRLPPDERAWAITCLLVAPAMRGRGLARELVAGVLDLLVRRGVERIEAFPRRGDRLAEDDAWTGPLALFTGLGFEVVAEHETWPVVAFDPGRHAPARG